MAMSDRSGIFAGDDPFDIARSWLAEAERTEPNDPNAIALATVDEPVRPAPPRPGGIRGPEPALRAALLGGAV